MRPNTRAVSSIDSLAPSCSSSLFIMTGKPPSSPNAVAKAERVRVDGFSYSIASVSPAKR